MKTWMTGVAALGLMASQDGAVELDLLNKENVVASRLEGKWKVHADLSKRLWGRAAESIDVEFTYDKTALPEEVLKKLGTRTKGKTTFTIYAIGKMKLDAKEYPFLLTALHGNPHVVYFRERNGNPLGDTESFNLGVASAKVKDNDLLLVGGDFNNQPFTILERTK